MGIYMYIYIGSMDERATEQRNMLGRLLLLLLLEIGTGILEVYMCINMHTEHNIVHIL